MKPSQLPKREEVPSQYQWDLTPMYASDQDFLEALEEFQGRLGNLDQLPGSLSESSDHLFEALEIISDYQRTMGNLYVYSHLKNDQDQGNDHYQTLEAQASQVAVALSEKLAFLQPELVAMDPDTLQAFMATDSRLAKYRQFLDDAVRYRAHTLTKDQESILAQAGEIFSTNTKTFGLLNNADLKFPDAQDQKGQTYPLSHGTYSRYLESNDRQLRESTFKQYYSVYDQFQNTFAALLSAQMKKGNLQAKLRNYQSARQAALFDDNIPEVVYDLLLETVHDHLDLLHEYVDMRKEVLELDQLEMYDMYTPLLGKAPLAFSYDEAKEIVLEALAPLGEDYLAIIKQAFDQGWIDVYENQGKRSGAYSSGTYDSYPYILLNWQDNLNNLYTLVHELGHSAHSYLTNQAQSYVDSHYSIFLAEMASTTNENLLTDYLLKTYPDKEVRLYILNHFLDGVKGTVFRQSQFAEFEQFIYQEDAKGQPLTANFLNQAYQELNAKYYGSSVNSQSQIALEWTRIPHFYYNFYVYQYATGFAAATEFARRISQGEAGAVSGYLSFLKAGSSDYPIAIMQEAGIDMTQPDYLLSTFAVFKDRLGEFKQLLASKEGE
ncbi:oligoendopeptidase F [Hutsoniella sourekii]